MGTHFTCKTHGKFEAQRQWGCPDCTKELREENAALRAAVEAGERLSHMVAAAMEFESADGFPSCGETIRIYNIPDSVVTRLVAAANAFDQAKPEPKTKETQ